MHTMTGTIPELTLKGKCMPLKILTGTMTSAFVKELFLNPDWNVYTYGTIVLM